MEGCHSLQIDHIRIKPAWLDTFSDTKDAEDMAPTLMHDFSSSSDQFHNLHGLTQSIVDQLKHEDFYSSSNLDHIGQNVDHFEQSIEDFEINLKSDTKKHRRKASAPQRAVTKESMVFSSNNDSLLHISESSQDDLPIDSQEFEKIKTEKLFKIEQILESDALEELRYQKLSNLDRLLDSESLNDNMLLDEQVDNFLNMENGDWKKFLNEFEAQDIFKDLQEEGDGETLETEIFTNVKEEFKAHWGVKCNMCESVFAYKTEFDKHYMSSYKQRPVYTCTFCDKSVDKYSTFRTHCYRHVTENRFKCNQCSKGFSLKAMLQVHILTKHTEAKPYMCEECGRSFVTKPGLKIHLKKHKIENKEDYPCVECGKVLHTRGGLTSHMNVHRLGRRFMCDICGKTFTQKVNMQQHVKQHTGNKPHECKTCGKSFAERSHLARHHSLHSVERPFKCSVCNKMYKTERCLKVHSLVHSEARPYTCEYCKKGFLSSTKLKQHYNIHTGERPYKCKYCERTFTNYPNWLKHIRRRHKVDHKTGAELPGSQPQTKPTTELKQEKNNQNDTPITSENHVSPIIPDKNKKMFETVTDTARLNELHLPLDSKDLIETINDNKVTTKNPLMLQETKVKIPSPVFSENEETSDKTHLDVETNLMLDKNLDLDGKSLVLNYKSVIFDDIKPCIKSIDKLVSEKLIENIQIQNNLNESLLLNDVSLLKSDDTQDSTFSTFPVFDHTKSVIGPQLEFLTGSTGSPVNTMTYLVPCLQNSLPHQIIIQNSPQSSIPVGDLVSSGNLVQ